MSQDTKSYMYYDFIYIKVRTGKTVYLWNAYLGVKAYSMDKVNKK